MMLTSDQEPRLLEFFSTFRPCGYVELHSSNGKFLWVSLQTDMPSEGDFELHGWREWCDAPVIEKLIKSEYPEMLI